MEELTNHDEASLLLGAVYVYKRLRYPTHAHKLVLFLLLIVGAAAYNFATSLILHHYYYNPPPIIANGALPMLADAIDLVVVLLYESRSYSARRPSRSRRKCQPSLPASSSSQLGGRIAHEQLRPFVS